LFGFPSQSNTSMLVPVEVVRGGVGQPGLVPPGLVNVTGRARLSRSQTDSISAARPISAVAGSGGARPVRTAR
jgi:hypothetical protein